MKSIYVHIPFCIKKCGYCDFNSYSGMDRLIPAYFKALTKEAGAFAAGAGKNRFAAESLYIGGGTPSLPDANLIAELTEKLADLFAIGHGAEITLEANPCSLDRQKLEIYRKCGINRLSIGIQSTHDAQLRILGRSHDRRIFLDSYEAARSAGYKNINLDLIFGVPGQTGDMWNATLDEIVALGPEHISTYSLTLDEGVPMMKMLESGQLTQVDESLEREMYHTAIRRLSAVGYRHYEISNFAREGYESRHNLNYWETGEYAGFGAGAHSYIGGVRYSNKPDPLDYIETAGTAACVEESHGLGREEMISEYFILGLRKTSGVDLEDAEKRFGKNVMEPFTGRIEKLVSRGILISQNGSIRLTEYGLDVANQAMIEFI